MNKFFIIIIILLFSYSSHSQSKTENRDLSEASKPEIKGARQDLFLREDLIKYIVNTESDILEISEAILNEVYRSKSILISGICLLNDRKFELAIDTLLVAKRKLEFLLQPVYLNQANLFLAFAFYQLSDFKTTNSYLNNIDYKCNILQSSLMASDLYYNIGNAKKAAKVYKSILRRELSNLKAHERLYILYKDELNSPQKANKYKTRYDQIIKGKKKEELPSDDLEFEISEMRQVN